MIVPYLVLDLGYLCYRAFYSTGHLSFEETKTGVLFGVFRDIKTFSELFGSNRFVFCFDSKESKRKELLGTYKESRKTKYETMDVDELRAHAELRLQRELLETKYLPAIGYRNILSATGYEADDHIAAVCNGLKSDEEAVVVGTDGDLFQVLREGVTIWNPAKSKAITAESFTSYWGISPSQWSDVKALAGCGTDDVPGLDGVGEKTAAKFLTGKLKPGGVSYRKIIASNDLWKKNLELVRLPLAGCPVPELVPDEFTTEKWMRVMDRLGMSSLRELSIV